MVNAEQVISLVTFVVLLLVAFSYFNALKQPSQTPLEVLGFDISDRLLAEKYLQWNASRVAIIVNVTRNFTSYPVDIGYVFPANTNASSIRVRTLNGTLLVQQSNMSASSVAFLANLTTGTNVFAMYYSADSNFTVLSFSTDLSYPALGASNSAMNATFSSQGDLLTLSNASASQLVSEGLYVSGAKFSASTYERDAGPVRVRYKFVGAAVNKTWSIYAYNPRLRLNVDGASGSFAWNTRWNTGFTRYYVNSTLNGTLSGSNATKVQSVITGVADLYGQSGVAASGSLNATIFDSSDFRELNVTNRSAAGYEIFMHAGGYWDGVSGGEAYSNLLVTKGASDVVRGISLGKMDALKQRPYADLKAELGTVKDFYLEIENKSSGNVLLSYGGQLPNASSVVVVKRYENLMTSSYANQEVEMRVRVW